MSNKNPYPQGVRLNDAEYQILQMALTGMWEHAKSENKIELATTCADLASRLQQYAIVGQGVPDEIAERFNKRMQKAMMTQNPEAISKVLAEWFATLIRLEPDPAKTIASQVVEMTTNLAGQAQLSQIVPPVLSNIGLKIRGLREQYDEQGWPEGSDVLTFLESWIEHGKTNVEAGHEPWAGDEHVG